MKSFDMDLKEKCEEAALFLRNKNNVWNSQRGNKGLEKVFSKEHEFVAEVYRLMVSKNENYRDSLRIDYLLPEPGQEKRSVAPDITYYDKDYTAAVEVKVVVTKKSKGYPRINTHDFERIDGDYFHKLMKSGYYGHFDKKYMVVVFLGEYNHGFSQEEFQRTICEKYPGTNDIMVMSF